MTKALYVIHAEKAALAPEMTIGIGVATRCASTVDVLLFGSETLSRAFTEVQGVSTVYQMQGDVYAHGLAEPCAAAIAELGQSYDVILMAADTTGKNILPRVSGLLKRPMLSDVIAIEKNAIVRPIYAGNALETVQVNGSYLMSYRPTSFQPITATQSPCAVEKITTARTNTQSEWVSMTAPEKTRPDLANAKCVVAGGRGLKSKEQFQLIERLADCLGAAVGASRAAVDAGFVPNECQVGQTGKVVAPALYIAIGISGAIQHVAGMKSSKVIVAINQDPEAPIFNIADYGWVEDLFVAIPALEKALKDGLPT